MTVDAEYTEHPPAIRAQEAPALFGTDPVESITKMVAVADALKGILVGKKLVSNIQGKEYVRVEGWQVLAGMLRLSAVTEWTRPVDGGWEARTVVYDPMGNIVGAGEGQCTRSERAWANRDDYALRMMCQTRSTSRALRNVLGFIVSLAGYSATPAEEVPKEGFNGLPAARVPAPRRESPPERAQPPQATQRPPAPEPAPQEPAAAPPEPAPVAGPNARPWETHPGKGSPVALINRAIALHLVRDKPAFVEWVSKQFGASLNSSTQIQPGTNLYVAIEAELARIEGEERANATRKAWPGFERDAERNHSSGI